MQKMYNLYINNKNKIQKVGKKLFLSLFLYAKHKLYKLNGFVIFKKIINALIE